MMQNPEKTDYYSLGECKHKNYGLLSIWFKRKRGGPMKSVGELLDFPRRYLDTSFPVTLYLNIHQK